MGKYDSKVRLNQMVTQRNQADGNDLMINRPRGTEKNGRTSWGVSQEHDSSWLYNCKNGYTSLTDNENGSSIHNQATYIEKQ